jgi:7,8-dihydropterin-6-yl-methyl-4-(beta-D-ribofuranosyl)aminobenzene 5'-phosphate synthase
MRITLEPVDGVEVTTLMDNSSDALLPDEDSIRRWGLVGSAGPIPVVANDVALGGKGVDMLRAEHGFSALIEVRADGRARRVLFDTGVTPDGLVGNLDRLALDPGTFEAIVFSHGHFDHVMGLHGLVGRLGRTGVPVVLHPDAWLQRRLVGPDRVFDMPAPSRVAIEEAGFAVIEEQQPSFLLDGVLLITGEVDRTTDFETGMARHEAYRDGRWQPDRLVHDDQAVVLNVRDRGLVVLTGCGHAGVVNIVRYAKRLTGVDRLHAILGGFHLRDGEIVPRTVAALAAEAPTLVVPAHCTSWRAHMALAAGLPDAYRPNAVGSRFTL